MKLEGLSLRIFRASVVTSSPNLATWVFPQFATVILPYFALHCLQFWRLQCYIIMYHSHSRCHSHYIHNYSHIVRILWANICFSPKNEEWGPSPIIRIMAKLLMELAWPHILEHPSWRPHDLSETRKPAERKQGTRTAYPTLACSERSGESLCSHASSDGVGGCSCLAERCITFPKQRWIDSKNDLKLSSITTLQTCPAGFRIYMSLKVDKWWVSISKLNQSI